MECLGWSCIYYVRAGDSSFCVCCCIEDLVFSFYIVFDVMFFVDCAVRAIKEGNGFLSGNGDGRRLAAQKFESPFPLRCFLFFFVISRSHSSYKHTQPWAEKWLYKDTTPVPRVAHIHEASGFAGESEPQLLTFPQQSGVKTASK